MPDSLLEFPLHIDLPRVIVWDALVDADLVEGWLGAADIDPRTGGRYLVSWGGGGDIPPLDGVIVAFEPVSHLRIDAGRAGFVDFDLAELVGGSRQSSTALVVRVGSATPPRMSARTIAHWRSNLDQLADLLRGHPVVWETWPQIRGPIWDDYLSQAGMREIR